MKWLKRFAIVLVIALALPPLVLWIMGQRSGAGTAQGSTEIAASPEQLWPWVEDGEHLKQWVSWLVAVKAWDRPQAGVGAKRSWTMRDENNGGVLMEIQSECTEYAPPNLLTVRTHVNSTFDGTQRYRLTQVGNGHTRMDVEMAFQFQSGLAKLFEPLIARAARKKMEGDMAKLKSLVETKAEAR